MIGDTGTEERRIESIAAGSEVSLNRNASQAWVDPHKQQSNLVRYQVRQGLIRETLQLVAGEPNPFRGRV